jgi:hypothetical protein
VTCVSSNILVYCFDVVVLQQLNNVAPGAANELLSRVHLAVFYPNLPKDGRALKDENCSGYI